MCPESTYLGSCSSCSYSADGCAISCQCKNGNGQNVPAEVQLSPSATEGCLLENAFGVLNCSRSCSNGTTAVTTPTTTVGQCHYDLDGIDRTHSILMRSLVSAQRCQLCPDSSYLGSCSSCSYSADGCSISCQCKNGNGQNVPAEVELSPSATEGCLLENAFGVLNCSRSCSNGTTAVTTPTTTVGQCHYDLDGIDRTHSILMRSLVSAQRCQLCPESSYLGSCSSCSYSADGCSISCQCKNANGQNVSAEVQLSPSATEGCLLENAYGLLQCPKSCSIGSTTVTTPTTIVSKCHDDFDSDRSTELAIAPIQFKSALWFQLHDVRCAQNRATSVHAPTVCIPPMDVRSAVSVRMPMVRTFPQKCSYRQARRKGVYWRMHSGCSSVRSLVPSEAQQ